MKVYYVVITTKTGSTHAIINAKNIDELTNKVSEITEYHHFQVYETFEYGQATVIESNCKVIYNENIG